MTETITRLRQTLMLLEKEALHLDAVAHRLFPQHAPLRSKIWVASHKRECRRLTPLLDIVRALAIAVHWAKQIGKSLVVECEYPKV